MNKTNLITFVVIVLILIGAGFYAYKVQKPDNEIEQSDASRALASNENNIYTDLDGNKVDLSVYEGKVRVVNSWATWCPFCIKELSDFGTLAKENTQNEVVVISVNRAEPVLKAKAFVSRLSGVDNVIFIQDPNDTLYTAIGGFSMPETVFYRADGSIAIHKRGFMDLEEMREHLNTALNTNKE